MFEIPLEYGQRIYIPTSANQSSSSTIGTAIQISNNLIIVSAEQRWFWTDEWQQGERRVDEYIQAGDFEVYDTMEDFLRTLEE